MCQKERAARGRPFPNSGLKRAYLEAGAEEAASAAALEADGIRTRLVSLPCWELFEKQSVAYQASVIGEGTVRVAVEAGVRQGWDRFIGEKGHFVGMSSFGASAPYQVLYEKFGITAAGVVAAAKAGLKA